MGGFTIGRLAEEAGVHVETVRYYERRGLLDQPPRPGPGSGSGSGSTSRYRRYTDDHLWRLRFIARGKQLGFTLAEIGEILAGSSGQSPGGAQPAGGTQSSLPSQVAAAARAKIAAVDAELHELAVRRCRLEQLARLCDRGDAADCLALRVAG